MMNIHADFSAFRLARWYEYMVRFVAGGIATVLAALVAKKFGPVVGGLFLALPAILPSSLTLVQSHELKKKRRANINKAVFARKAAGLDAAGAALGSVGLLAFAVFVWKLLPRWPVWAVLMAATVTWFGLAVVVWRCRRIVRLRP